MAFDSRQLYVELRRDIGSHIYAHIRAAPHISQRIRLPERLARSPLDAIRRARHQGVVGSEDEASARFGFEIPELR